jgi:hypothetical protein
LALRTRNQPKANAAAHHQKAEGIGRALVASDMAGRSLNEEGKMKKAERQMKGAETCCVKFVIRGILWAGAEWRR